jgi:O-antigen/teichoic acid export membrane protein
VLLARSLNASGYGIYTYVMTWISVLSVLAGMGLDKLLVRDIAAYQTTSAWPTVGGLLRWATRVGLFASLGLSATAVAVSWALVPRANAYWLPIFWTALISLPVLTLMRVQQAAMQGLNQVVVGQLPGMLFHPSLFIVLIGSASLFSKEYLTAQMMVGMNIVAAVLACAIGAKLLDKTFPHAVHISPPTYQASLWLRSALPLMFLASVQVIKSRTDILLLGALRGAEAVGVYSVATRGADLITFFLIANNASLAPTIASLYAKGDLDQLQRVVTSSARLTLLCSLPLAVGLIGGGQWFFTLFGPDFTQGQATLAILSAGQFINVAMGSVGQLLIMTGHERDAARGVGISALSNVLLNIILIPHWGVEGAAAATASSTILWNILLAKWVYKRLGIHSTALGRAGLRRIPVTDAKTGG